MTTGWREGSVDRLALAVLGLMLAVSLTLRLVPSGGAGAAAEGVGRPFVDLGGGLVLLPDATSPRDVTVGGCGAPISVAFVEPSPHGADASLVSPRNGDDRVVYAYHGWTVGGRFAAAQLAILHFVRRGTSILRLDKAGQRDGLAVKLTIPAGCAVTPDEALSAVRREVQAGR